MRKTLKTFNITVIFLGRLFGILYRIFLISRKQHYSPTGGYNYKTLLHGQIFLYLVSSCVISDLRQCPDHPVRIYFALKTSRLYIIHYITPSGKSGDE